MNRISIGGIVDTDEFVVGFGLLHLSAKKYPKSFLCEYHDMTDSQYWHWLHELNRANGWKHKSNFIAWYEYKYGGPKSLIGDLELFAEYMYDEYGVRVSLSRSRLKALSIAFREEKKFKDLNEAVSLSKRYIRRVSVVFEGHPGAGILCRELLSHKYVNGADGIELKLFNSVPNMETFTVFLHDDLVALPCEGLGHKSVKVAKNLADAVGDCDLLIFMGNDTCEKEVRKLKGLRDIELNSLSNFWSRMGNMVNDYAKNPDMKILFTCMKYPCFNATFFVHAAPNLSHDLIVAVTHHIAFPPLVYQSRASGIPMANILQKTAHVWGSPGISHMVDLGNTDAIYNRANWKEVLKTTEEFKSQIVWDKGNPFDNVELEDDLAWMKLDPVNDALNNTWKYVTLEKEMGTNCYGREPFLASIRATMEVLGYWFADEIAEIPVSVGICSTGGYDVPKGLVFSVPALVKDDRRRGWYDFHWCDRCRQILDLDSRPRWTEELCTRKSCKTNAMPQTCYHFRNPDIFLPCDPLLNLDDIIKTVITVFFELDGKGETLTKLLEKNDVDKFLTSSGELLNYYKPTRPLVDEYAEKIRKELRQLQDEWFDFVGKDVNFDEELKLWKLKKKKSKAPKKSKESEKHFHGEEQEEERKDSERLSEDTVHELGSISVDELLGEEAEGIERYSDQPQSIRASEEEENVGERGVRKLKRRIKEEQELEERAKRIIEAITDEDVPILRLYPNPPEVPKDIVETKGDEWLENDELRRKAEAHFDALGDERPSLKYRREYYAKRMAEIEQYCEEIVPKAFGYLYCHHSKEGHKKMKEAFVNSRISLLPYPPPVLTEVMIDRFVPPEPELGEDDATYEMRWYEAKTRFDAKVAEDVEKRAKNTLYYGSSNVRVHLVDDWSEIPENLVFMNRGDTNET